MLPPLELAGSRRWSQLQRQEEEEEQEEDEAACHGGGCQHTVGPTVGILWVPVTTLSEMERTNDTRQSAANNWALHVTMRRWQYNIKIIQSTSFLS